MGIANGNFPSRNPLKKPCPWGVRGAHGSLARPKASIQEPGIHGNFRENPLETCPNKWKSFVKCYENAFCTLTISLHYTIDARVRAHIVGRGTQRSAGNAFSDIPWGVRGAHGSLARPKHRFKAAHDMGFLEISIRIQTKPVKPHF